MMKHPQIILWIVAGVFLFAELVNRHSAQITEDYVKVKGEICNLEEYETMKRGVSVTRYAYDMVWEDEGEVYVKSLDGQVDVPEEGECYFWVSPDNKNAALSSSETMDSEKGKNFSVALIAAVLGLVVHFVQRAGRKESYSEKRERLENTRLYSGICAGVGVVGMIIGGVMSYKDYRGTDYFDPLMLDLILVFALVFVVSLIIFLVTGRKYRAK